MITRQRAQLDMLLLSNSNGSLQFPSQIRKGRSDGFLKPSNLLCRTLPGKHSRLKLLQFALVGDVALLHLLEHLLRMAAFRAHLADAVLHGLLLQGCFLLQTLESCTFVLVFSNNILCLLSKMSSSQRCFSLDDFNCA